MKKHSVESPFVPISPARYWARQRNFMLFRLRGAKAVTAPYALEVFHNDDYLLKAALIIDKTLSSMISHIETSHATYEESKKTRRKDFLE